MTLQLEPLQLSDFDTIEHHANIYEPGDDLVGPPSPIAWPVSTREEAQKRLRFTMAKQRRRFQGDQTAHYVKVVDMPSGEIVSIARWHYYETGYDFETMSHWEMAECLPGEGWPEGLNRGMHDFILLNRDMTRAEWIGVGKPAWILMHMVTRQSHRGRGAAGMLISWGIEQSERGGVPAYLEAGAQGRPIYEKYGFRQVGDLRQLDIRPYGLDMVFELANMVRFPESKRSSDTDK